MERVPLEEVVPSMGWGFLADNILHMLKKPDQTLATNERELLGSAIHFLERALEGAESSSRDRLAAGGIGRIVESMTLFGYASRALQHPPLSISEKAQIKKELAELLGICRDWSEGRGLKQVERLTPFFQAMARVTLRETDSILSAASSPEMVWPRIRSTSLA